MKFESKSVGESGEHVVQAVRDGVPRLTIIFPDTFLRTATDREHSASIEQAFEEMEGHFSEAEKDAVRAQSAATCVTAKGRPAPVRSNPKHP
jgi:hypothetical protein